jgi:ATP synthase protein I
MPPALRVRFSKRSIFRQQRHIDRAPILRDGEAVMTASGDEKNDQQNGEDAQLRARLDKLGQALDAQRAAPRAEDAGDPADLAGQSAGRAMSLGFRVLTEFVAAIVVSTLIGWQIDVWAKTGPVFLIIFLALGTAAGFWSVYRIAVGPTGGKNRPR